MEAKQVGKKIAELRKKNNMTQRELAEKLNVIDKTVSRWECGYGLPDIVIVPEIAAIFHVSIEDILGENPIVSKEAESLSEAPVAVAVSKERYPKKKILIASFAALLVLAVVCTVLLSVFLKKPANVPESIEGDCFSVAKNSDGDNVFITAFGYEECMSLELWGGDTGRFACQESWTESSGANIINCRIIGKYSIDKDIIFFYGEKLIDPLETGKLRLDGQLGLDCFTANLEYAEDGTIAAVVFSADTRNAETSAFGRWTKYANYFSRVESEIYFEPVKSGEITFEQCLRLPEFATVSLGVTLPYRISCELERYEFYVGEVIEEKDIKLNLVYSDGTAERLENFECELIGRELTVSDSAFNVHKTIETGKMTASVKIKVRYGYSWERAESSSADFTYFTVYNTNDWISFGCLELFGSEEGGKFIYSENCGKGKFSSVAVVAGQYTVTENAIHFVSTAVYTDGNYQSKFYINSEGDWFIAYAENDFDAISFKTGYLARHLFGHFCSAPNENSFSREDGEVYFERLAGGLSERAENCIATYSYMQN